MYRIVKAIFKKYSTSNWLKLLELSCRPCHLNSMTNPFLVHNGAIIIWFQIGYFIKENQESWFKAIRDQRTLVQFLKTPEHQPVSLIVHGSVDCGGVY